MAGQGRDIRTTELEKSDKRMSKPTEVLKNLKNHFYKLSKKNKSDAASATLPIIRNADTASNTTDTSSTAANGTNSAASCSLESVRNAEPSQQTIINQNVEPAQSSVKSISTLMMNDQKSPSEVMDQLPQARASQSHLMSTDDAKDVVVDSNFYSSCFDYNGATNNIAKFKRLKALIDENEKTKKREEQLFVIKNQLLAKIDLVKKQIDEAMDHYRNIAHACHEKIEKEEIRQNELIMDLKERVDKLDDMCTDINNQVDDMTVTLSAAYNVSGSNALYIITACSVDFIISFLKQIYATAISITVHSTKAILAASNSISPTAAITKEKKVDALMPTSL
ncbi:unnamed protein product [Litomosoides sigmodontis]|uniref:Uncharacterized protein n=1 Tax=Litomosoides sigmodontis TaxID=42156 RepID=A0A3P6TPL8_LITSI|nr:unnamed protein product [Litomosoides sigmodontis]